MKNSSEHLITILAGGNSERLMPFTSTSYPKQFNKEIILENKSLFQKTIKNAQAINKNAHIAIFINAKHTFLAREQISDIGLKNYTLIIEPISKNTMTSLVLATAFANFIGKSKIMLLPCDHALSRPKEHVRLLRKMLGIESSAVHIVGHKPSSLKLSGLGIIVANRNSKRVISKHVNQFLEKPDLKTIEAIQTNHQLQAYVNFGIVFATTKILLDEVEKANKDLLKKCEKIIHKSDINNNEMIIKKSDFLHIKKESFDVGLIEKISSLKFCEARTPLEDVGTIQSLINHKPINDKSSTNIKQIRTENCYVFNAKENRKITTINTKDICVYSDHKETIIFSKNSAKATTLLQEISKKPHNKEYKAWGHWEILFTGNQYQIKKLFVLPKKSLSAQYHKKRSETYLVLEGSAKIRKGSEFFHITQHQTIEIPALTIHQIINTSDQDNLVILELQYGHKITENDIIRV